MERVEVITSVERRRRYTDEEKARIIAETYREGASVSGVARKHGVSPSLVFGWRRALEATALAPASRPELKVLEATPDDHAFLRLEAAAPEERSVGIIRIWIGEDVSLELPSTIEPKTLSGLVATLRG